jgi:hypothetical protein
VIEKANWMRCHGRPSLIAIPPMGIAIARS